MTEPMKVALVWNHRSRLLDCSFRFEQYLDGFRSLGHQPVVVCDKASAEDFSGPLEIAETATDLEQPDFWSRVAADVAVIVTWHRMTVVLKAIAFAGTRVISIADTDGQLSLRCYPRAALERLMVYQNSFAGRARCLKYWLGRYLRETVGDSEEDREALASTQASDTVIFGHGHGQRHFERFLARYGEGALSKRFATVPFTIGASFLRCAVPATKCNRIVAIGRWDDPQKNAGLLVSAIARLLDSGAETEVVIFGRGGDTWFAPLAQRYPAVRVAGVQPQEVVASTLSDARSIVFSSRWEGSPHAALEALALGATLVGPPIPSLTSWAEGNRYGTISRSSRPASLAHALRDELSAWDQNRRDPQSISSHWRSVLAPEVVCRRLLEALPPQEPSLP